LPNPTEVKPQPEIDLEGHETGGYATVDPEKPLRPSRSRSWTTVTAP
jgi:elongation factor G